MTRAEADAWVADSVYPTSVFHVTTIEAAITIRRRGFDLSRRSDGRAWGDGVYAALDQGTLGHYLRQLGARGVALELRVNVRRVLSLHILNSSRRLPLLQALAQIPDGLARFIDAGLQAPNRATAFTHVVTEAGYDALEIWEDRFTPEVGGNQLVVFDPRRVVVCDGAHT
jgi:hypothetical protein